ncbi:MAG: TonB-dependent receptor plug domain-containing protein [bacterium]
MRILYYNIKLPWVLIVLLFYTHEGLPQISRPVPAPSQSDSTSTVNSDSLKFKKEKLDMRWHANAQNTGSLIAEDIGDFTELLPNSFPLDLGSIGQFSPLTSRGTNEQEGKILLDGIVLQEPINGFVNTTNIPINLVKDMAFSSAGSFVPFGAQAIAGILQIDTYQFQGVHPYSKVFFRAGDWGYSDLGVIFGLPLTKNTSFMISGNRQEFSGFELNRKHTGSRIASKISYQPNSAFALNFTAFLNKDEVQVPAPLLPDLVPRTANARRKENRIDQTLSVKIGDLPRQNRQFLGHIYFAKIRQESFGDTLLFNNKNLSFATGLQYEMITGKQWFTAGGEIRLDDLKSAELSSHADQIGHIFVRDRFQVTNRLRLRLQALLEKHDGYSTAFNPSAQLHYALSKISNIWVGIQKTKRYPSFSERYWPTLFFRGNPNLNVEKGTTFELGYVLKNGETLKIKSAIFRTHVNDWIGAANRVDSLSYGPSNLGDRTISGLDLKFIWNYFSTGQFGFIGSFLNVQENSLAKQLQVPEYSIYSYLEMGRPFFQDYVFIKLRLIGRFFGERFGPFYAGPAALPEITKLGANIVLDGQSTFQFKDAKLTVSWENLLDKRYQLVPGFFMPPRTLRFSIEWEFWD